MSQIVRTQTKTAEVGEAVRIRRMRLESRRQGWALMIEDFGEPAWVVSNPRRALREAHKAATYHGARLTVPDQLATLGRGASHEA